MGITHRPKMAPVRSLQFAPAPPKAAIFYPEATAKTPAKPKPSGKATAAE